jgi:hypothetical protein
MKSIRPYLLTVAALLVFALVARAADTFVQGQKVQITDTNQANVVTTTPVGFKRGLDVNCIGGCSGGGGSVVTIDGGYVLANQGLSNDGGFNWHVDVGQWGGVATSLGQKVSASSVPVVLASDQSPINVNVIFDGGSKLVTQGLSNDGGYDWHTDVARFGGNPVVTGTGASGSGIPRVTVSNDSNVLATQSGTWTVQQGTPPWSVSQSGAPWSFVGTKSNNGGAPGATNLGVLSAVSTAAAPAYTEGNQVALSTDNSGNLRTTATISGTTTANQGLSNDGGFNWHTDVAQWGGVNTTLGQKVSASSVPVVIASDQSAVPVSQSGTWTVNSHTQDNSGNGIESAITEVVGTNRGLLIRPVDKTLTAPVITQINCGTVSIALPTTAGRKTICIENEGAGDIFIGPVGVTTATGFPIGVNTSWCDDVGSQAYFCINASGTNDVRVLEN